MFGYVICNRQRLAKEEIDRYQGMYCGVCRSLQRQFGQLERFTLNYDMTFLGLLLSALYEPEDVQRNFRCAIHPLREKLSIENEYIDYAAQMTIALAYFKCKDDWADEHKLGSYKYADILKKSYEKVKEKYPRQCNAIADSIYELSKIEKSAHSIPDDAINCAGKMLSEVFVYKEDHWSETLRTFGYELGKFIYLMDAAMDYKQDKKKGNYNPLFKMDKKPEEIKDILVMEMGNAVEQFEHLPIVQDAHLLRNILYGGVWQKYYATYPEKEDAQ